MRYLFGFVVMRKLAVATMLAGLWTLPQSASAQPGEEGTTPEPNLQEPTPSVEPAPEEPALQLELTPAGVEVVPSPPRTVDGYTLEEMELRVRRTKIGLGISGGAFLGGVVMIAVALPEANIICIFECPPSPNWVTPVGTFGALLTIGGLIGMIASAVILGRGRTELSELQEAHYGRPRRVQWDLAQSRVVF